LEEEEFNNEQTLSLEILPNLNQMLNQGSVVGYVKATSPFCLKNKTLQSIYSDQSKMSDWKKGVVEELKLRQRKKPEGVILPIFSEETYGEEEILACIESLLTGQLSMNKNVAKMEEEFCKYTGSKYAVMVNSGSSANLLAVSAALDDGEGHLKHGSEVLVPAVCWSTSVWPIVQLGLKPVFVDTDPYTLNVDLNDLKKKITKNTTGFLAVHVMGNGTDMEELMKIVKENNLCLIEDTCESLGSSSNGKLLGTFGEFGTFSFFVSHHMTTGEGGMVTCQTEEQYDMLKSMVCKNF
jgi:dTDP-4-amino-4,6-dideoxygalactose transaminase